MLSLERCRSHWCNSVLQQSGVCTGCSVLAEVVYYFFFDGVPLSRNLAESSSGWVVCCILRPYLGGGVCGLRRCRSAIQLVGLLVVLFRPGILWDFFRYYCHIALNEASQIKTE